MRTPRTRAFTLLEAVVAIGIVAAAFAFSVAAVTSFKGSEDAAAENVALRIANTKLAELRAGGESALPASGPFSSPELSVLANASASTTVTAWNTKTKQVTTAVAWSDSKGRARYLAVTTLVTEVGGL